MLGFLLFIHLKGKPHFLQFCIYFCLLLPTQKTKLPSINLSDPVDYLNSNVGWLVVRVYGCGFFFLSCGSHATHTKRCLWLWPSCFPDEYFSCTLRNQPDAFNKEERAVFTGTDLAEVLTRPAQFANEITRRLMSPRKKVMM